jgi:PilZ domain-containing protein
MSIDQRKEQRYNVPDPCQQYIALKVKKGLEIVPAVIGNFSRNGILFECPLQFNKGDRAECMLRVNLVIAREITFGIEVKYCYENNGSFISGAGIYTISEEAWLDAFEAIFDFVVVRQGNK